MRISVKLSNSLVISSKNLCNKQQNVAILEKQILRIFLEDTLHKLIFQQF